LLAFAVGCSDPAGPSAVADARSDAPVSETTPDGANPSCPEGPTAPLGEACTSPGLTCRYGYTRPECGGRTVICRDAKWAEVDHTEPQPACFDAGADATDSETDGPDGG
jgi:hypothetical protein